MILVFRNGCVISLELKLECKRKVAEKWVSYATGVTSELPMHYFKHGYGMASSACYHRTNSQCEIILIRGE